MGSQPLNPKFMISPENCHPCLCSLDTGKVVKDPDEIPQNAAFRQAYHLLQGGRSGLRLYNGSGVKPQLVGWCLMLICSWTHRGST